jgi:hypothetical protein
MMQKLKKLSGMSSAEMAHRAREQFRRTADKLRYRAQFRLDDDRQLDELIRQHDSSLKTYFLRGPARRFYSSTQNREAVISFVMQQFPQWLDRALQRAEILCEHRVKLLAYADVPLGDNINWHRDPISGFEWPRQYWADYDMVGSPPADVKIVHELNRQQHLPRLAKAFFLSGDEKYAGEAIGQIESWIQQNAKWNGVNWQSSLEIALRSISWLWTIFLLLPSASLDEERLRRICRSLFAQLDHVYRYPSVYTSPNTHLIGEATSLFVAGVLFPELPRAQHWREFGARTLIEQMRRQVSNDGVYGELSSYYHCYATDFYLHALVLAEGTRGQSPRPPDPFPEWMYECLSRMLDFVLHITRPDGTIPLLGDDDGGRSWAIDSENYSSYRDGLCTGSVLFGRCDFKYQADAFREETLWLLGPECLERFNSIDARPPEELCRAFEDAGYFIQRSGWGARDTQVVFDCGGMGIGSGGHGHADALSITVFSDGHDFLVDPGTSVYNCAPEWRRFFRSTAAHNTVIAGNAGRYEPGDTFRWKTKTAAWLRKQITLAEIGYIDGEVNRTGITHRRRLIHIQPNYWIVLDELRGKGEHDFDFLFHFSPEAQLSVMSDEKRGEIDCHVQIENSALQLCMYASEVIQAEAICGQSEPVQGWASRLYGERRASPVLQARVHGLAPVSMMSFIVPGKDAAYSRRFKANTKNAIAAVIRDGEYDDFVVMAVEDGDLRFMDYAMRGEFFWLRTEQGNLRRLLAVNARSFGWAGESVFESHTVIPYVQAYFWEDGIVIEHGEKEGKVYVRDLRDRQFQR